MDFFHCVYAFEIHLPFLMYQEFIPFHYGISQMDHGLSLYPLTREHVYCFCFLTTMNRNATDIHVQVLCEHHFIPRSGIAGHRVGVCWIL